MYLNRDWFILADIIGAIGAVALDENGLCQRHLSDLPCFVGEKKKKILVRTSQEEAYIKFDRIYCMTESLGRYAKQ